MKVNKVAINGQELPPYHARVVQDALVDFDAHMNHRCALGESKEAETERQKRLTALKQINSLFQ